MPDQPRLKVAVSGASGFIGRAVVDRLSSDGCEVLRLVRREARGPGEVHWDPGGGQVDASALDGSDAVVHLAGESIAQRWTPAAKERIATSRIEGTRALATALARLPRPPRVLVGASAVGVYGANRGSEVLTEESAPGGDFLAEVARGWEAAADPLRGAGTRVVHLRFGLVLSRRGGALKSMLPPFRLGLGGPLGDGRHWMSWISLQDVAGLAAAAIRDERMSGAYNAVAGAATNRDFTRALGEALHRPALIPVPGFALKLLFGGEMVDGTLLASQRAEPARLRELGFRFLHPDLQSALQAAVSD